MATSARLRSSSTDCSCARSLERSACAARAENVVSASSTSSEGTSGCSNCSCRAPSGGWPRSKTQEPDVTANGERAASASATSRSSCSALPNVPATYGCRSSPSRQTTAPSAPLPCAASRAISSAVRCSSRPVASASPPRRRRSRAGSCETPLPFPPRPASATAACSAASRPRVSSSAVKDCACRKSSSRPSSRSPSAIGSASAISNPSRYPAERKASPSAAGATLEPWSSAATEVDEAETARASSKRPPSSSTRTTTTSAPAAAAAASAIAPNASSRELPSASRRSAPVKASSAVAPSTAPVVRPGSMLIAPHPEVWRHASTRGF